MWSRTGAPPVIYCALLVGLCRVVPVASSRGPFSQPCARPHHLTPQSSTVGFRVRLCGRVHAFHHISPETYLSLFHFTFFRLLPSHNSCFIYHYTFLRPRSQKVSRPHAYALGTPLPLSLVSYIRFTREEHVRWFIVNGRRAQHALRLLGPRRRCGRGSDWPSSAICLAGVGCAA